MKKLFLTIFLAAVTGLSLNAQEIKWMSMNEALEAQQKKPKKIFMDAYTEWCGPCKMLDKNTFSNKDVIRYVNKHYYPVKFNAEGTDTVNYKERVFRNDNYVPNKRGRNNTHDFTLALGVRAYPSLVFFDETGNLIGPIPGYRTPQELEIFLKLFSGEEYKNITTQEAYQEYARNFEHEFETSQ